MNNSEYNSQIEKISSLLEEDKISLNEEDPKILQKYYDYAKSNFKLDESGANQLVNEAFLYLKLKNSTDADPLQDGDKFGVGFS